MKKNKKIISLTAAAALLCVGGAFALNANTTVSADTNPVATESQQIMLGASVLLDGVVDTGDDTGIIRFPVIVRDEVKKQIVESKIYVLPQASWEKETPPTPQEIMGHAEKFEGITKNQEGSIDKWVDYYEDIKPYDSDYEQAVVYMKNIPMEQFASAFHVCSWMKLSDGTTVTEDFSEVVSRSMEYVAAAAVNSGEYTTEQLGKYLTTEVNYTVTPYLRTIYGTYKAADAENVTGYNGVNVTAQDLVQDGYTINKALTAQANADLAVAENATFNVYYENDAHEFATQNFVRFEANTSTVTKKALTGVAATDMQANTYEVVQTVPAGQDGNPEFWFSYPGDKVGQYLVMSVYYTKKSTGAGIGGLNVWTSGGGECPVYGYSDEGKLLISLTDALVLNKWVNVVVKVPTTSDNRLKMTLSQYAMDSWYLGEYTFITEDDFEANFEQVQPLDTSLTGVEHYYGTSIVNTHDDVTARLIISNNILTAKPSSTNGISYHSMKVSTHLTYTMGEYVVFRVMPSTDHYTISFGGTQFAFYTEDGLLTDSPKAYNWYYYVVKITAEDGGTANRWTYCIRFEKQAEVFIGEVYVAKDDAAYDLLRNKLFPNGGNT